MKYILGGGIAGLIFKFYNPEYKIITKDVGGQLRSNFQLGPRYLHLDKYSNRFVRDIGRFVKFHRSVCNIGYYYNGDFHDKLNDSVIKDYIKKTSRDVNIDGIMNSGKSTFRYWKFDYEKLIEFFYKKFEKDIIIDDIISIDINNKLIYTKSTTFKYDKIVSTIPAIVFIKLTNTFIENEFSYYKPISFFVINLIFPKKYDFVYFIDNIIPFYRVTRINDKISVIEFLGDDFDKYNDYLHKSYIAFYIEKYGKIINENLKLIENPDIIYLGRYAEWKHNIRINQVIKKSIDISKGI